MPSCPSAVEACTGVPIFGPRLVTPALEAGAFAFFEVASTLGLVAAAEVKVSRDPCGILRLYGSRCAGQGTYWWCSSNALGCV